MAAVFEKIFCCGSSDTVERTELLDDKLQDNQQVPSKLSMPVGTTELLEEQNSDDTDDERSDNDCNNGGNDKARPVAQEDQLSIGTSSTQQKNIDKEHSPKEQREAYTKIIKNENADKTIDEKDDSESDNGKAGSKEQRSDMDRIQSGQDDSEARSVSKEDLQGQQSTVGITVGNVDRQHPVEGETANDNIEMKENLKAISMCQEECHLASHSTVGSIEDNTAHRQTPGEYSAAEDIDKTQPADREDLRFSKPTRLSEYADKRQYYEEIYNIDIISPSTTRELVKGYRHELKRVDMSERRRCLYNQYFDPLRPDKTVTSTLGDEISPQKTADGVPFVVRIPVESRGITLRQLRAIQANVSRRCVEEAWVDHQRSDEPVTTESVNVYHVNDYVVKPFTKSSRASLVETLPSTAGTQPPRIFITHWWGLPFNDLIACVEQLVHDFRANLNEETDAQGGGMTEDTPVWISAFAISQWEEEGLDEAKGLESAFAKAMRIASYRIVSILDTEGVAFSRIWFDYELYINLTLRRKEGDLNGGILAVYTAHKHYCHSFLNSSMYHDGERAAVGIVPGGAPGEVAVFTSLREKHFPAELTLRFLDIKVQSAETSMESDRRYILNSIILGHDNDTNVHVTSTNSPPPVSHLNYDEVNDIVTGAFAVSMPTVALKAALIAGEKEWKKMLAVLSRGIMSGTFDLDFRSFIVPHSLSSIQAYELVTHIPVTCSGLNIRFLAHGEDCEGAMEGIIEWMGKGKVNVGFKALCCSHCKVGDTERGRGMGSRLANELSSNHAESMEELAILHTDVVDSGNVSDWASALRKMYKLKKLHLDFSDVEISEEDKEILRKAAHTTNINF